LHTFIDLFSGAGGLSEGFVRAGFEPISHIEMNKEACNTLVTRAAYHYLKEKGDLGPYRSYLLGEISRIDFLGNIPNDVLESVIHSEISDESISEIFEKIDSRLTDEKRVDLIIGGPPCQAYSLVGRARDPNGMKEDPRNHLYLQYVEFLKKYKPKMFVFENVPGIYSANNSTQMSKIEKAINDAGYIIGHNKILNSKNFNVLQDRKRVIIIGWSKDYEFTIPEFQQLDLQENRGFELLYKDLPFLNNGEGLWGAQLYANSKINNYLTDSKIRNSDFEFVTQHVCRPNNPNDLEIYRIASQKLKIEGRKLSYNELPDRLKRHKNNNAFLNRFNVVGDNILSQTVVAHIAMDGHYFIHPDTEQNRSISVREAARIQSFPDDFFFEGSRTSAFKQIGNAVPPLMAEGIANVIKSIFSNKTIVSNDRV
jgi:DNA (cytosine-5)-methyltransferase 1